MQKWEYGFLWFGIKGAKFSAVFNRKTINRIDENDFPNATPAIIIRTLKELAFKELGQEGWELAQDSVTCIIHDKDTIDDLKTAIIFKRPIE